MLRFTILGLGSRLLINRPDNLSYAEIRV